jgi:hypothetical protein
LGSDPPGVPVYLWRFGCQQRNGTNKLKKKKKVNKSSNFESKNQEASDETISSSGSLMMGKLRGTSEGDDPVKLIIAGAPASGKGTQCEVIKEMYGCVHLSTGDMLRAAVAAGTDVGKKAKEYMDNGKLVPDEVIIGVVCAVPQRGIYICMGKYLVLTNLPIAKHNLGQRSLG